MNALWHSPQLETEESRNQRYERLWAFPGYECYIAFPAYQGMETVRLRKPNLPRGGKDRGSESPRPRRGRKYRLRGLGIPESTV